jgi:hypothetical protein
MRDRTTPKALHARATGLWQHEPDPDPRSTQYAAAEKQALVGDRASGAGGNKRAANWISALHRYEGFWNAHARAPRENTRNRATLPGSERRMGEWARYQRRFEDDLCRYQKIRLDVSPAFSWDPLERDWQKHLDECRSHWVENGRLPLLIASEPAEFIQARWLGRQLRQLQAGTLPESRAARLSKLLTFGSESGGRIRR